ncbi:PREDICTED: thionin-like protein 2 [Camelina sativa]|uniref:Thionin-like protein 2 n=1 Tax=Camelina sativa TaxID=90675 RepID=A0ABM0VN52_CAMSA|nr:PREDICTED: thionin-like protein 2 [Camelina sativa]
MESKRVATLMMNNIMIVMVLMGYLLVQTSEAKSTSHFKVCYSNCHMVCKSHTTFPKSLFCPFTCLLTCLVPTPPSPSPSYYTTGLTNKIDRTDYFCKLGCATHHCVSLSSLQNPNAEKVATCVDSCSEKCSKENKN